MQGSRNVVCGSDVRCHRQVPNRKFVRAKQGQREAMACLKFSIKGYCACVQYLVLVSPFPQNGAIPTLAT